jgi:alanine dehydrogenase
MALRAFKRIIGIPKEIKSKEFRVALTPQYVQELSSVGCKVLVETEAGKSSGFLDSDYARAGATIASKQSIFALSDIIVKVKEPQPSEYDLIKKDQVIFTFFHFAGCQGLKEAMLDRGAVCFAYESVQLKDKSLPILMPMSDIAGKLAIQEGMRLMTSVHDGTGTLLSGVPGVKPAKVVIIGGGTVGSSAARLAARIGAQVYILDTNVNKLRTLASQMPNNVITLYNSFSTLKENLLDADLVVGAALIPAKEAPKLVNKVMLESMKPGSVFMDVAIDQGGMTELSMPTTHENPVIKVKKTLLYCVPNMPGIVPNTATLALTNSTFPYIMSLAQKGWKTAVQERQELGAALLI